MPEITPNQYDGEFAALLHQREMESLSSSLIAEKVVVAAASGAEKLGLPIGGLIRWALKNGQTPLETIVEQIESSAAAAIARHEKRLDGHDKELKELWEKLLGQEAQTAYRAAVFHGMRTSDPAKHARLGALTINSICADDLIPERLDEVMRAAVELNEHDIRVLKSIYEMQVYFFTPAEMGKPYNFRIDAIRSRWETWWEHYGLTYLTDGGEAFRSSTARLQSTGLIISIGQVHVLAGPSVNDFELLIEGKRFYERLQEVAVSQ